MPEDKPPEKPDWLKPEEFDEVEHLPETPLEQMRQEHVTNLRTPAFNREVTLADVLLELRKHHVEMVLEDVLVELKAIRTAIESVIVTWPADTNVGKYGRPIRPGVRINPRHLEPPD